MYISDLLGGETTQKFSVPQNGDKLYYCINTNISPTTFAHSPNTAILK